LVGLNERKFEVIAWKNGSFSVVGIIKNCIDNFVWRLVVVYGSPYEEGKADFLGELEGLLANRDGPTVIKGDYNIVTIAKEKNNGQVNKKWADSFLDLINKWGLIELKNSNRSYTWTNKQDQPILPALDKIFCTVNFQQKIPLAFMTAKARVGSDHVPLVLNLGVTESKKSSLFTFEKWWLEQPDFKNLVKTVCSLCL